MRVDVKPMSMNQSYHGRRFKTKLYKAYETACMIRMVPMEIPEGNLWLTIWVGVSSKGFDIDNCAKPFIDILQKKYGFNDNRIYVLHIMKEIVKKGDEFIEFEIRESPENQKY